MSPEWFEKQNKRYRYVTEYNRDNAIDCLFTMAEIKYWGLEDCNRVQIEW